MTMSAREEIGTVAVDYGWTVTENDDKTLRVSRGDWYLHVRWTPTGRIRFALSDDRVYGGTNTVRAAVLTYLRDQGARFVVRLTDSGYGVWDLTLRRWAVQPDRDVQSWADSDQRSLESWCAEVSAELIDGVAVHTITGDWSDAEVYAFTQACEAFADHDVMVFGSRVAVMFMAWPCVITEGDTGEFHRQSVSWDVVGSGPRKGGYAAPYRVAVREALSLGLPVADAPTATEPPNPPTQCPAIHPDAVPGADHYTACSLGHDHGGDHHEDDYGRQWPHARCERCRNADAHRIAKATGALLCGDCVGDLTDGSADDYSVPMTETALTVYRQGGAPSFHHIRIGVSVAAYIDRAREYDTDPARAALYRVALATLAQQWGVRLLRCLPDQVATLMQVADRMSAATLDGHSMRAAAALAREARYALNPYGQGE